MMKYIVVIVILLIGCDQSGGGGKWEAPPWHTSYRDRCRMAEEEEDYSCVCTDTTYGIGKTYFNVEASSPWCASQKAYDLWWMDCDAIQEEDPSVLCSCSCEEE